MFQRILVANRGEIALRVIRACRDLGIEAVAVFSEADRGAPYLDLADEAICIGPAQASGSYLNVAHIISAAELANVQAIHPGYGFLSENAAFAEACRAYERDCSLQRRHQKLVEESPAPNLPEHVRDNICIAAVRLVREAHYQNAGTCEFLVDKDNNFYFIEVNARIQVEHPVTEL